MGILRLKSRYGAQKLERACEVLIQHGATKPRVRDVEKMINSPNLERRPVSLPINRKPNPHLRGQMRFKQKEKMSMEALNQTDQYLMELKLKGVRESISRRIQEALDSDLGYEDFMNLILFDEVQHRQNEKRIRLLERPWYLRHRQSSNN